MKKIYQQIICAIILGAICSGCAWFLPPGEAPEGKITDNSQDNKLSSEELMHHAATSLCGFLLTTPEITSINCADMISERVLRETSSVTGTVLNRASRYTLSCRNDGKKVYFTIICSGKTLWSYPE